MINVVILEHINSSGLERPEVEVIPLYRFATEFSTVFDLNLIEYKKTRELLFDAAMQYIIQEEKTYEEIREQHGNHIQQADTDDIVENEVKFFIWSEPADWTFSVVPVYRKEEWLYLGREEVFYFENDGWVQNFFDGTK